MTLRTRTTWFRSGGNWWARALQPGHEFAEGVLELGMVGSVEVVEPDDGLRNVASFLHYLQLQSQELRTAIRGREDARVEAQPCKAFEHSTSEEGGARCISSRGAVPRTQPHPSPRKPPEDRGLTSPHRIAGRTICGRVLRSDDVSHMWRVCLCRAPHG